MKKFLLAALVLFSFSSFSAYATNTEGELAENHASHAEKRITTHVDHAKDGTSGPETAVKEVQAANE